MKKSFPTLIHPIFLFKGWCKKCGICVDFCPHKVYEWGEDRYPDVSHPEKCKNCGLCEYRCPDFAITVLKLRK
ncbi:MAG: ferredoxin family protein [Candidatus Xenobiia bacterium LiM19]